MQVGKCYSVEPGLLKLNKVTKVECTYIDAARHVEPEPPPGYALAVLKKVDCRYRTGFTLQFFGGINNSISLKNSSFKYSFNLKFDCYSVFVPWFLRNSFLYFSNV
jgi:hypothetical protein